MILSKYSILFFSLSIMVLQGCAAPGVRPEDANIFQQAGNLGSGEFERQTNRKRLNVIQSEQELVQAQARFDALRRNSAALQQQKQQLDREYWLITQKNIKLEKNIQTIQIKNSNDKRKQKVAQRKLNKIKQQAKVVQSQSSRISTKEYRKRIAVLNSDIRALEDEYLAD
jgi:chromosome segregation ATPase